MRGSIVKRGDGFGVVLDLGHDPQTGKRRQKWHSGFHTKREAAAELAKLVNDVNRGAHVPKTRETVAEYVTDWLAAITPPPCGRPRTTPTPATCGCTSCPTWAPPPWHRWAAAH